jgi:hypothetical protein
MTEGQEQKIKDEHRTSNIERPTSNEKIEKLATDAHRRTPDK